MTRLIFEAPPLTILVYPDTDRAVLVGPGGLQVVSLSIAALGRAAELAREGGRPA